MKKIVISGMELTLKGITGTVLSPQKSRETQIRSGSSGNSNSVSINSITIVHDQFFLLGEDGMEYSYQLKGFDIACRDGHTLSVVSATKQGSINSRNIAVVNQSTGNLFFCSRGDLFVVAWPNTFLFKCIGAALVFLALTCIFSSWTFSSFLGVLILATYSLIVILRNASKIKRAVEASDYKTAKSFTA